MAREFYGKKPPRHPGVKGKDLRFEVKGKGKPPKGRKPSRGRRPSRPSAPRGYDPLAPLTGENLERELTAATRLRYGPQERQLESERRISGQAYANTADWYTKYLQDTEQMRQQAQQGYVQATQQVNDQANLGASQDAAANAARDAEAQKSAAIRGASPAQSQGLQASQANRALSSSFSGMLADSGGGSERLRGFSGVYCFWPAGVGAWEGAGASEVDREGCGGVAGRQGRVWLQVPWRCS